MADSYIDLANRREVYIARFASHLRNEYTNVSIDEAYRLARLILLDAENINSIKKRDAVLEAVKEAVKPVTADMWQELTGELTDFAAIEATYYATMFGAVNAVNLSVPATDKIADYVTKATMSLESSKGAQTGKWSQFVTANTNSVYRQMNEQIKAGYRNGETVQQMVKRLRVIKDGMLKNQAEALVRTGTAHYSLNARRAMADDNLDVLSREVCNVTFDNRVTDICISINARYPDGWEINKSPIGYPPYHFGCRTTILYLVDGQKEIDGTKAYVGGKKGETAEESFENRQTRLNNKRNSPDNDKPVASQVRRTGNKDKAFSAGQVKASTPFATWLKTQPDWFISDTLGTERAKLFLDGKLDLSKLTDSKLKPLTLKEIAGE